MFKRIANLLLMINAVAMCPFILWKGSEGEVKAQNLVPNPSFEDTLYCPFEADQISATKFWYKPTQGSTDYLNSCASADISIPNNYYGYQPSHYGSGYAAIVLLFDSINLNYREYLQVQLISPLIVGKKYFVSAFVAKADSTPMAIKDIGIALSNNAIGGSYTTPINFTPQIIYSQFLTDTVNWTEISDTIVASGGEQYLTIGYFKYNNTNDTLSLFYTPSFDKQAYYYVDDVSVVEDTATGINENIFIKEVKIHLNDGILFIQLNTETKATAEIYNLLGQIIYSENLTPFRNNYFINLSQQTNSMYLLRIKTDKVIMSQKFFLIK